MLESCLTLKLHWVSDINVGDKHKHRHKEKKRPFFFFLLSVSLSGHKCWVSTRGKCSNSPISLLEWAHRFFPSLPFCSCLPLCLYAGAVLISSLFHRDSLTCPKGIWLCPPHPIQSKQSSPASYYAEHTQRTPLSRSFIQGQAHAVHIYIAREEEQVHKTQFKKKPHLKQ